MQKKPTHLLGSLLVPQRPSLGKPPTTSRSFLSSPSSLRRLRRPMRRFTTLLAVLLALIPFSLTPATPLSPSAPRAFSAVATLPLPLVRQNCRFLCNGRQVTLLSQCVCWATLKGFLTSSGSLKNQALRACRRRFGNRISGFRGACVAMELIRAGGGLKRPKLIMRGKNTRKCGCRNRN